MDITVSDVKESLNEYFKLKQKYESEIAANKKKIINNSSLSNREKRNEYMKLKPKCINCKRPGGTIFKITSFSEDHNTESYREYNATCGIIADPCGLKIKIQYGKTDLLTDILKNIEDEMKEIKDKIIDDKNKLLFGYLTTEDALNDFDYSKESLNTYSELYEDYLGKYNSIVENDEKKTELEESITESYIQINKIKDCILKNNETNNITYIRDAIDIYDTILVPTLNKIRDLKYNENFVWHNEYTNTCNLMQNKYSISNMSFSSFQSKVINFEFSIKGKKPALIIESESEEQEEETSVIGEIPEDEPIYGKGKDGIAWNISEYNTLWDKLPSKFKSALRPNNDWMKDFMHKCVNARANGKACEVTSPKDLKLPPTKLENGQYDFGVQIYSDLFNKLAVPVQDNYLKLFSEKNGVKNYDMLENTMNALVSKETGFEKGFF